jgi:hypothetical protein
MLASILSLAAYHRTLLKLWVNGKHEIGLYKAIGLTASDGSSKMHVVAGIFDPTVVFLCAFVKDFFFFNAVGSTPIC